MKNDLTLHLQTKKLVDGLSFSHQFEQDIDMSLWQNKIKITNDNSRFFRVTELSAQEQFTLRQDLENVLACMKDPHYVWVYYLSGTKTGIEIYIGVVQVGKNGDVLEQSQLLKNQLIGNIGGVQLEDVKEQGLQTYILNPLQASQHFGVVTGVPSLTLDQQADRQGESITQGLDRLATSLNGEEWQLLIVAQPEELSAINSKIDQLLVLSSTLHPHIKQSLQESQNTGTSQTVTKGSSTGQSITEQEGKNLSTTTTEGKNDGGSKSTTDGTSLSDTTSSGSNDGGSKTNTKGTNSSKESNSSSNKETKGISDSIAEAKSWGTNKGESKTVGKSTSKAETTTWGTNKGTSKTEGKSSGTAKAKTTGTNDSTAQGTSSGESSNHSIEVLNQKLERMEKHINEKQIPRFELGRGKGLFQTAVYISAKYPVIYERLALAITAIFQGNQMLFSPLQVRKLKFKDKNIYKLFDIHWVKTQLGDEMGLIHSIPTHNQRIAYATWLNASELSLLAGLPSREVCGIRLRKNVDFAVNTHKSNEHDDFELGNIIQNGSELLHAKVYLNKKLLNQHIFISGVTGAGKTTTCQQILMQSGLPFLVIEPAKTEYRSLYQYDTSIQYYTVNNENISPFRLNPFELLPNEQLAGHIDMLKATFAAVFPMEASMPYLIEEAIVRSYELKGWDVNTSMHILYENPWQHPEQCFPIMSEMLEVLKMVIKSKGFGQELQEKYEGSLISRLDNLTVGTKGRMLNTRISIDVNALLDQKAVIELDDLKDEQDKALLMGLLVGRVAEAIKQRHKKDVNFQHITLIEEAHRLLEKPEGADGAKKLGVNLFANLLAEVRKYGECLIIADQIPNKLTPEVLKNTNTKIIHRLFAIDDRQAIGETVGLTDEQKQFLPMLKAGEAVVYSAGWHEAVRTQVKKSSDTNAPEIDETIIAKASQERMFKQRHQLYRHVSDVLTTVNAEQFAQFIREGSFILNLWIRWYHQQQTQDKLWSKAQQELLIQRLQQEMQRFCATWQQNALPALAGLFEDMAPLAYVATSQQYSLQQCLILLFKLYGQQTLPEKIVDDQVFGLNTGRVIVHSLNSIFKQVKSL